MWADTDATYANDGPRTAEDFCSAHIGRVITVEGKNRQFSVRIEGSGEGCVECGMEGAACLGAKRDVSLERFSATENISYSAGRTLREGREESNE